MKELDILLSGFVESHEAELESGRWDDFETLLHFEDDVLWDCLQDPGRREAEPHRRLLTQIRGGRA